MPRVRCERCGHELRDKHIELDPDEMRRLLRDEVLPEYESDPVPIYGAAGFPIDEPVELTLREPPPPLFEVGETDGDYYIQVPGTPYCLRLPSPLYGEVAAKRIVARLNEAAELWKEQAR